MDVFQAAALVAFSPLHINYMGQPVKWSCVKTRSGAANPGLRM